MGGGVVGVGGRWGGGGAMNGIALSFKFGKCLASGSNPVRVF